MGTLVAQTIKNLPAIQKTPGSGRSPGDRNGHPLQYSCLEKIMDRGVISVPLKYNTISRFYFYTKNVANGKLFG